MRRFTQFITESNGITMPLADETFVHFTTLERARQIIADNKLRKNPEGIRKRGIDAVTAISLTYGDHVPTVQTDGIEGSYIAIMFKTNTLPEYGYVEEVVWDTDVVFSERPRPIPKERALQMLRDNDSIPDDVRVTYSP